MSICQAKIIFYFAFHRCATSSAQSYRHNKPQRYSSFTHAHWPRSPANPVTTNCLPFSLTPLFLHKLSIPPHSSGLGYHLAGLCLAWHTVFWVPPVWILFNFFHSHHLFQVWDGRFFILTDLCTYRSCHYLQKNI